MSAAGVCGSCAVLLPAGSRFCPTCGSPVAASIDPARRPAFGGTAEALADPAAEPVAVRKIVSVLFIDLTDSTVLAERLDPEALRRALDRYYSVCSRVIAFCGGEVEKFIGDAVMAVFGALVTREDDALRAVRAALAVPESLAGLAEELARDHGVTFGLHAGICSGEALVVRHSGAGARVNGDVVNIAARLQSSAARDELLLCDETARLLGGRVPLEAVGALRLKGKRSRVLTWRPAAAGPTDRPPGEPDDPVPLIGRGSELDWLRAQYTQARTGRDGRLAVLAGQAGIGKSRLVRELLTDQVRADAAVLQAGCHLYSAGFTYQPIADCVRSLSGAWPAARAALAAEGPDGARALRVLDALLDPHDCAVGESVTETGWALRRLVETLGRSRPVVLVVEDLQWAEPALIELLGDLVRAASGIALLVLCTARFGAGGQRPGRLVGIDDAAVLELGALAPGDARFLVEMLSRQAEVVAQTAQRGDDGLDDARLAELSEGNPLFAELLVEERNRGSAGTPTTVRVMIEAWLDHLPPPGRELLERAAAVGPTFTAEEVTAIAADCPALRGDSVVAAAMLRLADARVIERCMPRGSYRITRPLVRDIAYETAAKTRRAAWHRRLADRAQAHGDRLAFSGRHTAADRAHHLESACRLLGEVDPGDPQLPQLTERAARALIATGRQALRRRDLPAAGALLTRGRDLLPAADPEHRLLAVCISDAYAGLGDWPRALDALDRAERLAPDGERGVCLIQRAILELSTAGDSTPPPAPPGGATDGEDAFAWSRWHQFEGLRAFLRGRIGAAEDSMRRALEWARRSGDADEEGRLLAAVCELSQWSATPVDEGVRMCEQLSERFVGDRFLLVPVLLTRARLVALGGDLDSARETLALARRHCADLHLAVGLAAVDQVAGLIASLADDRVEAVLRYTAAADGLRALGQDVTAATLDVFAARELLADGDADACAASLDRLRPDALETRGLLAFFAVRAHLLAWRGRHGDVADAVRHARALLDRTDDPVLAGYVRFEAAKALWLAGETSAARAIAASAATDYARKGAELPCRMVNTWLHCHAPG